MLQCAQPKRAMFVGYTIRYIQKRKSEKLHVTNTQNHRIKAIIKVVPSEAGYQITQLANPLSYRYHHLLLTTSFIQKLAVVSFNCCPYDARYEERQRNQNRCD